MADTLIVNAAQAESWNGYEGEHWAARSSSGSATPGLARSPRHGPRSKTR